MILRIKDILKEKGITNREFARRMGTSPQYTNAVVMERRRASVVMLSRMAEALGVPLKEMFN
ncbi:MAG: helix-turn-helix transcriptional regulator [Prevotella sp.]|nr:helix-turn-helix transcriptional regulator [Prevotella sp.]